MTAVARWAFLVSMLAVGACGDRSSTPAAEVKGAESAAPAVAATGAIIEVKAITDDQGNRFEPSEVHARPGDVLRLVLVSGVHNISFPAERNASASGLPQPSDMLQLPGQTHDVPITFGPGEYHFQCDPHAALGMTGELEVEED